MLYNSGPFYMRRLPYRLGFRWYEDMVLQPGWSKATWEIPQWAAGPSAGIVGEWRSKRYRLYWHRVPIGRWREGQPRFRTHKRRKP